MIEELHKEVLLYNIVLIIAGFFILIATVMTLISTLNISFKERIKFFGLLKSVGFNNKNIFSICILQSIIICLIGSLVGTILSLLISKHIGLYLAKLLILRDTDMISSDIFAVNINHAMLAILILFFTSLVSALLPAIKCAYLSPIEALSREK